MVPHTAGGDDIFVQIADGESLLDIGGLNLTKRSTVQLGFINVTDELKGFQFGFLNIAKNGFLPFFPIFNFPKGTDSASTSTSTSTPSEFDMSASSTKSDVRCNPTLCRHRRFSSRCNVCVPPGPGTR